MEWINSPWPWYVSGPLIALTMFTLLYLGKNFGMSSNLRTLCTLCGAGKTSSFFRFDWKSQRWNLLFVVGTIIGGFIAANYLGPGQSPDIHPDSIASLANLGINSAGRHYAPTELYATEALQNPRTWAILIVSGLLIGFGTRYAGGCTSGHSISGLSNLQLPSLIATIGFFIGGILMVHILFPIIFN